MMYNQNLINLRILNNKKQKEMANILNITRSTYSDYEKEYQIIPIKHLITVCDYFQVSLDYIFDFTHKKQYHTTINDIDKIKIGLRLKEFRKTNNLTQLKISNILNTEQPVIANYENGKNLIATPFLYTICKKYYMSADYLLGKIDYIPDWCNKKDK